MLSKSVRWLLATTLFVSLVLAACGPAPTPEPTAAPEVSAPTSPPAAAEPKETLKVALVYVAPVGDMGWSWAHEQGRLALEEKFGDRIETAYIENVPEGPDAERVVRDFAEKDYDLVVTTSFGYMDPTATVAEEYPDTWFVHVSGYKTAENLSTIFGRIYQPRFLSGLVAGKATETNKIGYVAAFPIPEVIRGIDAFTLGVRTANPEATVHVVWTNTWYGPPEEKDAAEALLDQGCDVIAQHQDTTEPQKAAADRGAVSIGYDSDMSVFVGDTVLTSPVWDWGIKYSDIVQRIMDGTYSTESYWGGLETGVVALAPLSSRVPAETVALVDEYKAKILSGEWDVFCGPVKGQNGELSVAEGSCMSDEEMLNLEWFVEGVVGEAPASPPVAAAAEPKETLKVALVYVAPVGDMGWSWAHEQGRLALEEKFGDRIETAYIENVPEGPDAERVVRDFAEKDYDLVVTTSFGYMDPTATVAEEYPDTWFVHVSGYKTAENLSTIFGRIYQPRFLSGLVAGKATETNKIGYVAAFPIPEVIRGIDAFTLGVRTANPEATVHVVWTNTWYGPPEEKDAAEALLDQGCDVIAQHQDTTEPQKAAADRGAVSIGYDSDMSVFVGDTVLTSPVWDWGIKYSDIVQRIMDGTYSTESYWGGLETGVVALAPLSSRVPAETVALVENYQTKILSGEWDVFCGPVKGQGGELAVPLGTCLTDEEMLNLEWFVDGVVGEAPSSPPVAESPDLPSAAFVYVGPTGDMGWTYAHDQGRLALEAMGVETAYAELVAEGPDSERVVRDFAEKGYDVILATSFGFMDSVIAVAEDYPDIIFEHCTGYETAANVGIYDGRGYQPWYLAGIVAGEMTEKNKLGYIAPYPIPEVVRNMNAFTLGARSVNPDVEVHPVWLYSWVDPPKERDAAVALAAEGVDVIARESDSTEADKLAQEEGIYVIGYNSDVARDQSPDAFLTAPIWHWDVFYTKLIQDVAAGTWTNEPVWWGMKEGILDLAPIAGFVPDDVKALVEAEKARILSGEFDVFEGPINDNEGTERVAAGETMSDEEMLSFDWLVEGVIGQIPQ
ncbi:MAG: BMP family ABC transporter substrate-binding protein [Anaerolineae bacterium]|nr:BMP family ABC transporter substrate-binding protein [Anaerolineae bacterium]